MSNVSAAIKIKTPAETRRYGIDCTLDLEEGETIASVNSVSIDNATVPALTTASPAVSTTPFTNDLGGTCAAGKGLRVTIAAGLLGAKYNVTANYTTSLGNIQDAVLPIHIRSK